MRVTLVSLAPAEQARAAGAPALTPELLAATGARYSRSNEGLASILSRIDPAAPDKSVDGIFRMVDYGHQSIADMAPAAMFLDDVSMHLAWLVWSLCPTAGGQESSTRYIDLSAAATVAPDALGIPGSLRGAWQDAMGAAFRAYDAMLAAWRGLAERQPEVTRIPREVLADESEKGRRRLDRMLRNYAFDRARYFLPVAAPTNVMLVMSARGWVQLCRLLGSHPLPEAQALGDALRGQLALVTPRLLKHAVRTESLALGWQDEFARLAAWAAEPPPACLSPSATVTSAPPAPSLDVLAPAGVGDREFAEDLRRHDNRYAWTGASLRRTAVRFAWNAVAVAEIRDLNRHRTGSKHCPLLPQGFYAADDQVPAEATEASRAVRRALAEAARTGQELTARARAQLAAGDPTHVYWALLGTQYPFEHVTTADKFIYEAELRTGTGSHFRYAQHLRDALALWYARYPATRGLVLEGSAEPE